jgi:outer membrane scaffolding protein for murein synthesis (MipA/OmpV family)
MNEAGLMTKCHAGYILCLVFGISGTAIAEQHPLWEIGAGVGLLSIPDYRGSDEQRFYALPIPYLVYRGKILRVERDKLRGLLLHGDNWEFAISANAGVPVKSDNNDARRGMPNLDPTVELGPQLNITLAGSLDADYQLDLQLPVRQVWAVDWPQLHSVGKVFSPVLNLDLRDRWPSQGWRLGLQAGPLFADRDYHSYYYGVEPAYSRANRPAYSTSGGYSGMQGTVSLSRRFDNFWVGAFFRATDLHGAVIDDSPLVRQKTNLMGGLGVNWIFGRASRLVETDE